MILLVRLSKAWRSKHIGRMPSLRLLAFETRIEVDAFLKKHEIFDKKHEIFDYSATDFGQDRETLRELRMREARS